NLKIKAQELELREKKLAEQKYENLLRYENLANSIPHLIWRTTLKGELEYYNQKWLEYTGIGYNYVKENFFSLIHEEDLKEVKEIWLSSFNKPTLESFSYECRLKNKKNGKYNWFRNLVVAEKNQNGEKISWLGTSTD